jgi:plasmid maintenance system antidote protein VapI
MMKPTDRLRAALEERGWSSKELAWVIEDTRLAAENLSREVPITLTLALRLEAALDIPVWEWLGGMAPREIWVVSELMERELMRIRRRRHRLMELEGHEGDHLSY